MAATLFLASILANSRFSSTNIGVGVGLVIYSLFTIFFLSSMNDFTSDKLILSSNSFSKKASIV